MLDEETIARLQGEVLKKTFNNSGSTTENPNEIDDKTKDRLLEVVNKEKEKPNKFTQNVINFYDNYISGEAKTEFPNMKEIYQAGNKFSAVNFKMNMIKLVNPDKNAQMEMIVKSYPGSKITKDKFDNIILTLPKGIVGEQNDQSYYLDKAGITVDGVMNTTGQILMYIPGANWVLKNSVQKGFKKAAQVGATAAATGTTFDIISYSMGSTQGKGGILPVVEDDKFAINLVTASGGEKIAQLLSKYSFATKAKDYAKSKIPSNFNIFSGSGLYLDNKGIVTNKAKEILKKTISKSDYEKIVNNPEIMIPFAQGLEDGLGGNPEAAQLLAQIVGANRWGLSLWKAQASGNAEAAKKIDLMRNGFYGNELKFLVQAQDDIQLSQTFKYLTEYRDKLLKNKQSLDSAPPNTKQIATTQIDENIQAVTESLKATEAKMFASVEAKYAAIDYKNTFKKPVVTNIMRHFNNAIISPTNGVGQALNKTTMPNTYAAMSQLNGFFKKLENKNLNKITFGMLENNRQMINKIMQTTKDPLDLKALMIVKKRFDKFYDDAVDQGLANGGKNSKEIYAAIKKARDANTEYKKTFFPQNIKIGGGTIKDDGGAFLQKVINGDYSATQISNWLYGSNSLKGVFADKSLNVIKKLKTIFPDGSRGNDLIRDGAFLRVMEKSFKGYGSREFFSPELFVKNINEMVSGNGKAVTAQLFNPKEIKELVSFAKQLEKTIPPKIFTKGNAGVEEFTEFWKATTRAGVGIGGFNLGGIQSMLASRFAFDAATKQSARNAELTALKEAIFLSKIPQSSGGSGIVDITKETQNFIKKDTLRDFEGNKIPYVGDVENIGMIESMSKYKKYAN